MFLLVSSCQGIRNQPENEGLGNEGIAWRSAERLEQSRLPTEETVTRPTTDLLGSLKMRNWPHHWPRRAREDMAPSYASSQASS